MASGLRAAPARLARAVIAVYAWLISPWLGSHCRFHPSCSAYAAQAIARFGLVRGLGFTLRRLGRCHPWHPGGVDPVPQTLEAPGSCAAPTPPKAPPERVEMPWNSSG